MASFFVCSVLFGDCVFRNCVVGFLLKTKNLGITSTVKFSCFLTGTHSVRSCSINMLASLWKLTLREHGRLNLLSITTSVCVSRSKDGLKVVLFIGPFRSFSQSLKLRNSSFVNFCFVAFSHNVCSNSWSCLQKI